MDVKNVVECEMAENKPALNVEWLDLEWIFSATIPIQSIDIVGMKPSAPSLMLLRC